MLIDKSPAQKLLHLEKLRAELKEALRQSVPTDQLQDYYNCGWAYVMPNFDQPGHSIVEWLSNSMPVYPPRSLSPTENAHERSDSPHQ